MVVRATPLLPEAMPLAWSYRRTSTTRQAGTDRSGMDRQEQALAQWLLDHPDYQLAEALVDAGVSAGKGKNRKRGALARFIQGGRDGTVPPGSCLVVESWSRFSREVATDSLGALLSDIWGQGMAISFCTDGVVLTRELINAEDHRLHGLLGAIGQARREWEERSRRSKGACAKRRQLQDQGIKANGVVPFWIARDERGALVRDEHGGLVVDPVIGATIQRAVDLALGGLGVNRIARLLEAEGIPKPAQLRGTKNRWDSHVVRRMFCPAIAGTLVRGDRHVEDYYPKVIDVATYHRLTTALAGRDTLDSALRGRTKCRNLFEKMSRCSSCGGPVSWRSASASCGDHPGYVSCNVAARQPQLCTNKKVVRVDDFEAACLALLRSQVWRDLLLTPDDDVDLAEARTAVQRLEGEHHAVNNQLVTAQDRADRQWLEGAAEPLLEMAARTLTRLKQEQQALEKDLLAARQRLSVREAQPDRGDLAQELAQRVAAFSLGLAHASTDQRLTFNRWLFSRQPAVRLLLHPGHRLQLIVGEEAGPIQSINGPEARIALSFGGEAWAPEAPEPGEPGYEEFVAWAAEPIDWDAEWRELPNGG